ncbi:MAG: cobalamin-dependent protein [Nanoarchaeota archaeon]|nr:cobalamin-dependent protein [Nanoarchaeota archaeon]
MDITLIYPPLSVSERYARNVGEKGHLPPLGLALLAAYVRENGFKVRLIDALASGMSAADIIADIQKNDPRVIGITALTPNFHRVVSLAKTIKERFPKKLIIVGGPHAAIDPKAVLKENKCFDLICYKEGEFTLLDLLKKYQDQDYDYNYFILNHDLLGSIAGICFRKKDEIIMNLPQKPVHDLDALPFPARDLLPMDKYSPLPNQYKRLPLIHMLAHRGCPFNCSFCSTSTMFGRKVRLRSPERSIEEIEHCIEVYGAKDISFWDDLMTINKEWMKQFCELLIEKKLDITWTCCARVDTVDKETLILMKKAGCWNIFFGIESGSQELLDNINKGITLAQIRRTVKDCQDVGIEIRASFMLALPGETPELAQKTIDFAKELNPDYAQFCITTPYPGTQLYKDAKKFGTLSEDYSKYNIWEPVFVPFGYQNREEITKLEKRAVRQFYFRPAFFSKVAKNLLKNPKDIKRYIQGFRFLLGFIS